MVIEGGIKEKGEKDDDKFNRRDDREESGRDK